MKNPATKNEINRRNAMKLLTAGSAAGLLGLFGTRESRAEKYETPSYAKGMPQVKIRNVRSITTAPEGSNMIIVKVDTTEPGLYGLGCATFTQRAMAVLPAIDTYLNDFCVGKDVDNIEDMWQSAYVSSYWRNGPVLNNALSGLDEALWDIKGKRANLPVYQLLEESAELRDCYAHASDQLSKFWLKGYSNSWIRIQTCQIQQGGYGESERCRKSRTSNKQDLAGKKICIWISRHT